MDETLDLNLTEGEVNLDPVSIGASQIDLTEYAEILELTGGDLSPDDLEPIQLDKIEALLTGQAVEEIDEVANIEASGDSNIDPVTGDVAATNTDTPEYEPPPWWLGNYRAEFWAPETFVEYAAEHNLDVAEVFFDEQYYLSRNPDVATAVGQGFFTSGQDHFERYGKFEQRRPSEMFDPQSYVNNYPDVAASLAAGEYASAFDHFVQAGFSQGLSVRADLFDEDYYRRSNGDVREAIENGFFDSGYEHFIEHGQQEGREPNKYFETDLYLRQNQDVAAAVQAGFFESGFDHFAQYGEREGRQPGTWFVPDYYLNAHPDVREKIAAGEFRSGFDHFLEVGFDSGYAGHPRGFPWQMPPPAGLELQSASNAPETTKATGANYRDPLTGELISVSSVR
jgi:hypothetical protein